MSKKNNKPPRYWIMDGRANFDVDDAKIISCCETLKEARAEVGDYGDAVIVCSETQAVVK